MPKNSKTQAGIVHLLTLLVIAGLGLFVAGNIPTTKNLASTQSVLGENEEAKKAEEQAKEVAKKTEERQKEDSKSNSGSGNPKKSESETISSTGTKSKTKIEGNKQETEIETADGQKIKTKVEDDGTAKVEIERGQLKVKYVFENGVLKLKAENESGKEVELEDDELDEVESELEDDGIKIASASGRPVLSRNKIGAQTDFPLSIDIGTNQLIVSTPAGQKVVTVLPDQAVQNLLATNIINSVDSTGTDAAGELGALDSVVKLEMRNDEVVYRVKGVKTRRLFGLFSVNNSTTVFVSSESGLPVAQEQSLLANIVDSLSPQ
ncbi:MAG: Uncharacterized protein G01um10145_534 [Microgenomates group bacterium Gr01-1014_5]|nr:MAG: Uncharacterized protein G01um10145_534 [Microgenomates group bacterium Gr01-1014_5]